jgi:DNA mismatch repair protein MutS
LQVAAIAGVPPKVISAAKRYLAELEKRSAEANAYRPQQQLPFDVPAPTQVDHPALSMLKGLNPDAMTPREALDALYRLKGVS